VNFGAVTPEIMFLEMSMGMFKVAMDVYISYKFGELLFGSSADNAAHQLCTAGIHQHSG